MTRPATSVIRDYVRLIRDEMRLQAWDLDLRERKIGDDGDSDEVMGECEATGGRWHATLYFADTLFTEDPEFQRQVFVHELTHLTQLEATEGWREGAYRQQLGQALYDHAYGEFKRGMERMVDFTSRLIARSMPLPPWCQIHVATEHAPGRPACTCGWVAIPEGKGQSVEEAALLDHIREF